MRGQIRLNRKQQEPNQQSHGDPGMHVPRERQPAHEGEGPDAVDHVVHVEAIAGTLLPPKSCHGAIEAVAEPVQYEEGNPRQQPPSIPRASA